MSNSNYWSAKPPTVPTISTRSLPSAPAVELGLTSEAEDRLREHEPPLRALRHLQAEYAVALVYLNQRDAAIEHYRQALQLDPIHSQRAAELAMLLWSAERRATLTRPGAGRIMPPPWTLALRRC